MPRSRFAFGTLLLLGVVSAWTPNHRPVTTSKSPTKQPTFLNDFRPVQWATAGFLTASLALAPLPTFAADAPTIVADPPTSVKVDVDTDKLIKSIEESKGELNAAVSSIVKDTPSESIQLTPPPSKVDAVNEALNVGKEPEVPAVIEESKAESPKAEEPKAEVTVPAPTVPAPAPAAPAPVTAEVKTEEPKAVPQPSEPAAVVPKEESVTEAPKTAIVVQPPKKEAPPAPTTKAPSLLEVLKGMANTATPPAVSPVKPTEPAAKVVAPVEEMMLPEPLKPELPKLEASKEVAEAGTASVSGFENVLKSVIAPFRETKEEATRTNFDDVAFWERPAIRTALLSPDGKERLNLVFTNGEVAGGVGLAITLSYLTSYGLSGSSEMEEKSVPMKEETKASPSPAQPAPSSSGPSYLDRLDSKETAPPKQKLSMPKFPSIKVTSDSSIPGTSSYADSLSKSGRNKPAPKQQKSPGGGGSYLDSL